jgi:hypothetical protein
LSVESAPLPPTASVPEPKVAPPSVRPWGAIWFSLPVMLAGALLFKSWLVASLARVFVRNDWYWAALVQLESRQLETALRMDHLRLASRLGIGLAFLRWGDAPGRVNVALVVLNLVGGLLGYRLLRWLGAGRTVALVTAVAAFFAPANLEVFWSLSSSEMALGRTMVLAVVVAGLESRRPLVASALLLLAFVTHELALLTLPLLLLAWAHRDGVRGLAARVKSARLLSSVWLVGVALELLRRWMLSDVVAIRWSLREVPAGLVEIVRQQPVAWGVVLLLVLLSWVPRFAEPTRPSRVALLWSLLAVAPYAGLTVGRSEDSSELANWLLLWPVVSLLVSLGERLSSKRVGLAVAPGAAAAAILLFPAWRRLPVDDEPRRFHDAVAAAAQAAVGRDGSAKHRRFWFVGDDVPVGAEMGSVKDLLAVQSDFGQSAMLRLTLPGIAFAIQERRRDAFDPQQVRPGDALVGVVCGDAAGGERRCDFLVDRTAP